MKPQRLKPQGIRGIKKLGHREYVGCGWEFMGDLQFNFLISHGLKPYHHLWDIACGSLRAGVPLIRYLESGGDVPLIVELGGTSVAD
jgi:hypothetical protein